MARVVRFHSLGGPEVLQLEDTTVGEPGEGEVLLKVQAVGLNRAESMYFHGQYMEQPQLPSKLGYEAVGTVMKVGLGVSESLIGTQSSTFPGFSQNRYGLLGEAALVPANVLAELPPSLSLVERAAVWMQYGTAYGALVELGRVGSGEFVIITAASSSVGLAAIQIARAQGTTAIATTRSSAKRQQLKDLGADHVIATQEEDLPARVAEITGGKGARVAFDPVGGDYVKTLAQALAKEGIIYLYGSLSGQPTVFPMAAFAKGLALTSYTLLQMNTPERLPRLKQYVYDGLAKGTLKPRVDRVFPFDQVQEAYRYLESNAQVGKIVITI